MAPSASVLSEPELYPSRNVIREKTVVTGWIVPLKMAFVVVSFACDALLFVAPESRILLPRVATVRLFYEKGVLSLHGQMWGGKKKRGGERTLTLDFSAYISIQSF